MELLKNTSFNSNQNYCNQSIRISAGQKNQAWKVYSGRLHCPSPTAGWSGDDATIPPSPPTLTQSRTGSCCPVGRVEWLCASRLTGFHLRV